MAFVTFPEINERLHRNVSEGRKIIDMGPGGALAAVNFAPGWFARNPEFLDEHMAKSRVERLPQPLVLDKHAMPSHFPSRSDRPRTSGVLLLFSVPPSALRNVTEHYILNVRQRTDRIALDGVPEAVSGGL